MNNAMQRRRSTTVAAGVGGTAVALGMMLTASPAMANGSPARYIQLVKTNESGAPLAGAQYRLNAAGANILCPAGTWNRAIKARSTEVARGVPVPEPTYALSEKQVTQLEALTDPLGGDFNTWLQALMNVAAGASSPLSDPAAEAQTVTAATTKYLGQLAAVQSELTKGYAKLAGVLDPAVDDANRYTAAVQAAVKAGANATQAQTDAAAKDATSGEFSQAINALDPILQPATTTVTNQAAIDAANRANDEVATQAGKDYYSTWASAGCGSTRTVTTDARGHVDLVTSDGVPDGGSAATEHSTTWNSQLDVYVNVPNGRSPTPHSFTITATEIKAPRGYEVDPRPVTIKLAFFGLQPVFSVTYAGKGWSSAASNSGLPRYSVTQRDAAVPSDHNGGGHSVTGGGKRIDTGLGATGGSGPNVGLIGTGAGLGAVLLMGAGLLFRRARKLVTA